MIQYGARITSGERFKTLLVYRVLALDYGADLEMLLEYTREADY